MLIEAVMDRQQYVSTIKDKHGVQSKWVPQISGQIWGKFLWFTDEM